MSAVYSRYRSPDSFIILFVTLVRKQHLQRLCHSYEFGSKNQFEVFGKTEENADGITQNASGGLRRSSHVSWTRARVFEWHRRFREGEEGVDDKPRSGRPPSLKTDKNVEAVRQAVRGDRRLTVRMIADQVGIDRQTVWQIITEERRMRKNLRENGAQTASGRPENARNAGLRGHAPKHQE